jgi:hypothetical protein
MTQTTSSNKHIGDTCIDSKKLPIQFHLFLYGSKFLAQLASCLNIPEQTLRAAAQALSVHGYERMFFADSIIWKGSVATLEKTNDGKVNGIAILIKKVNINNQYDFYVGGTRINFVAIEKAEVFPKKYYLKYINDIDQTRVYAFVRNPSYIFNETKPVNNEYIKAICRTLRDRRLLNGSNININTKYEIAIRYVIPNIGKISNATEQIVVFSPKSIVTINSHQL